MKVGPEMKISIDKQNPSDKALDVLIGYRENLIV